MLRPARVERTLLSAAFDVALVPDLFAFKRYGPAFATAIRLASTVIAL